MGTHSLTDHITSRASCDAKKRPKICKSGNNHQTCQNSTKMSKCQIAEIPKSPKMQNFTINYKIAQNVQTGKSPKIPNITKNAKNQRKCKKSEKTQKQEKIKKIAKMQKM